MTLVWGCPTGQSLEWARDEQRTITSRCWKNLSGRPPWEGKASEPRYVDCINPESNLGPNKERTLLYRSLPANDFPAHIWRSCDDGRQAAMF